MKNKKLLKAFSLVDEKYLDEANPSESIKAVKGRKRIKIWGAVAACFCCALIGLNMWLFIPFKDAPPDVSVYSDSEYYELIVKLNDITYVKRSYKNNFEKYFRGIFKGATAEDAMESTAGAADGGSYEEVTDNQVKGVIEGDLIKRSSTHIYYLNVEKLMLEVYSISGEASELVGSYALTGGDDVRHIYSGELEMYLSEDCSTVTLVYPYYNNSSQSCVAFETLDVTDLENIVMKDRVRIIGSYLSSRLINGELLVLTQFHVGYNPDFSDESKFVPQIDVGEGFESIPVGDIISPEKLDYARYTVICKLDAATLELSDSSAFLSYSDDVYVSDEYAYATRSYSDIGENDGNKTVKRSMTEISRMKYSDESFGEVVSMTVEGYIKDQYSMDEYDGLFRVVTTTDVSEYTETKRSGYEATDDILLMSVIGDTNANLYVIDFASLETVSEVIAFAPDGEVVQSVRFDGATAYVCTSVQLTDPVFFFDLSDIENITVKDTGTIEGFSTSLINMGDGFLLGIGVGNSRSTLKVEVYEETESGVVSVDKYELDDTSYSTDYKSYYIDRDNGLIGLGVTLGYNNKNATSQSRSRYILLHFDGYEIRELVDVALDGNDEYKRGVYIDGYMYMLGSRGLTVEEVK